MQTKDPISSESTKMKIKNQKSAKKLMKNRKFRFFHPSTMTLYPPFVFFFLKAISEAQRGRRWANNRWKDQRKRSGNASPKSKEIDLTKPILILDGAEAF